MPQAHVMVTTAYMYRSSTLG